MIDRRERQFHGPALLFSRREIGDEQGPLFGSGLWCVINVGITVQKTVIRDGVACDLIVKDPTSQSMTPVSDGVNFKLESSADNLRM